MRNTWLAVGIVVGALLVAGGVESERPVVRPALQSADELEALERSMVSALDVDAQARVAEGYLLSGQSGLAIATIESAPAIVQSAPRIQDIYARALAHQGRAADALLVEERLLAQCEHAACPPWIIASASRRATLLAGLVHRGVDDEREEPEHSWVVYKQSARVAHIGAEP